MATWMNIKYTFPDLAMLFVALGVGYIVCYLADKEKKFMRNLGFLLGAVIIIGTCFLLLVKIGWRVKGMVSERECVKRNSRMNNMRPFIPEEGFVREQTQNK